MMEKEGDWRSGEVRGDKGVRILTFILRFSNFFLLVEERSQKRSIANVLVSDPTIKRELIKVQFFFVFFSFSFLFCVPRIIRAASRLRWYLYCLSRCQVVVY